MSSEWLIEQYINQTDKLQSEIRALNKEVQRVLQENATLQSELTKARELFRDIANDDQMWTICSIALARRIDEQLAHQPAPVAKGDKCLDGGTCGLGGFCKDCHNVKD